MKYLQLITFIIYGMSVVGQIIPEKPIGNSGNHITDSLENELRSVDPKKRFEVQFNLWTRKGYQKKI